MEENLKTFEDGSIKEVPVTLETIQEAKHIGLLRNIAGEIKSNVSQLYTSIKKGETIDCGMHLERINNLADQIIEES